MKFEFFTKTVEKYRPMFKSPILDWCQLMNGKSKTNAFLKMFLSGMKTAIPEFFHRCPYFGVHVGRNFSFLTGLVAFYPSGAFKFKASLFEDANEILIYVTDFIVF